MQKVKKCRIFISYHEQIDKSRNITDELAVFFEKWGIRCEPVRNTTSHTVPATKINKLIDDSDFFIQLFTKDPEPSEWMKKELFLWKERMKNDAVEPFLIYHCNETRGDENEYFKIEFCRLANDGKIKLINIDKKNDIQQSICDLLEGCKRIPSDHGEILYPAFCDGRHKTINIREIKEFIECFSESNADGLERVFANKKYAEDRIKQLLSKSRNIKMIGITLKRYVDPESTMGKEFIKALNNGAEAKLLLLSLDSGAAKNRSRIEDEGQSYSKSRLFKDGRKVRQYYNPRNNKRSKYNITIKDFEHPYMGLILLDNEAFIEIYHLGDAIKENAELCGKVPILNIRKESKFYTIFESHFDNQWPQ